MRKHKIDNARTYGHMFKNAPDSMSHVLIVDRDDVIDNPKALYENKVRDISVELTNKLQKRMQYKYFKGRNVRIPIQIIRFVKYDLDYDKVSFIVEVYYYRENHD